MESHRRSIAKAITYRIVGSCTTAGIVLLFFGQVGTAAAVGVVDVIFKMLVYFVHERAWNSISYGREKVEIEYTI